MIGECTNFCGVNARLNMNLGDTGLQITNCVIDAFATSCTPIVIEVIGENYSFFSGKSTEGEASLLGSQR